MRKTFQDSTVETNWKNLEILFLKAKNTYQKTNCGEFLNDHNHFSTNFLVNQMLESFQNKIQSQNFKKKKKGYSTTILISLDHIYIRAAKARVLEKIIFTFFN